MTQEVDLAITDVINESVLHETGKTAITLSLENLKQSESIKKKITDEFNNIVKLLDFNKTGYDIFRKWYVDGKLYHHIVIDKTKQKEGIKHLIPVDALDIKKVREVKREKDTISGVEYVKEIEEY